MRQTKGLPYRCEVRRFMEVGKLMTKLNLHHFRQLWITPIRPTVQTCTRILQYFLHPEAEDIREPKQNAVPKGRPRRCSNARDLSSFEKVTPRKSRKKVHNLYVQFQ
ncbi:hypothetical protein LINGRAPRIM_LOCUS531 [Linum grandiflorum]